MIAKTTRFGLALLAGMGIWAASCAADMAPAVRDLDGLSADAMHAASPALRYVEARQQAAYTQMLAAYDAAQRAHPDDASLAVAKCMFMQRFAYSEELGWSAAASRDLEACQVALKQQFPTDAASQLYGLEHLYGRAAIAAGTALLAPSSNWSIEQRARLHAALSVGYASDHQDAKAGEQAVQTVLLVPGHERLVSAIRYLGSQHQAAQAGVLLARAPVAKMPFLESLRINAALDVLPPGAALAELQRAEQAGLKIDGWTAAHVYRQVGQNAQAADALRRAPPNDFETPERRQFRFEVAMAAGDGVGAAQVLDSWVRKSGMTPVLAFAYANLLGRFPAAGLHSNLRAPVLWLFCVLLGVALAPGLLAFPAHYRGTVRARLRKPLTALFARIGLRHMWLGLVVFGAVSFLVGGLRQGALLATLNGNTIIAAADQQRFAMTNLWTTCLGMLCLAYTASRLSWPEWRGSGGVRALLAAALVWGIAIVLLHAVAAHHGGVMVQTAQTRAVAATIAGARAIAGVPFALLLFAVLAPLYEELVFRCCVLGGLTRHLSFGWANLIQALLFAAAHGDPPRFLFYFAMGLGLGWLVKRTRGLAAPLLLHALNNAYAVATMVSH
jgi:membrane protease YdiL (CAAX protease family)